MLKLSKTEAGNAAVFAAAGVYTSPNFMVHICEKTALLLERQTRLRVVRAQLLFPYGDWSSSLVRQIRQVHRDIRLKAETLGATEQSIGGRSLIEVIGDMSGIDYAVLIGHSGGGVAAVHAASALRRSAPELQTHIVQIGCPRCAIPPQLKHRVRYLYAVNRVNGNVKDPICRLGSWGGWEMSAFGIPRWNSRKFAPGESTPLPIIGGHADYFRDHEPFRNEAGRTNMDIVSETMLEGLVSPAK